MPFFTKGIKKNINFKGAGPAVLTGTLQVFFPSLTAKPRLTGTSCEYGS
jgi:hypothetical protein